jgi:hypothetical protein
LTKGIIISTVRPVERQIKQNDLEAQITALKELQYLQNLMAAKAATNKKGGFFKRITGKTALALRNLLKRRNFGNVFLVLEDRKKVKDILI